MAMERVMSSSSSSPFPFEGNWEKSEWNQNQGLLDCEHNVLITQLHCIMKLATVDSRLFGNSQHQLNVIDKLDYRL